MHLKDASFGVASTYQVHDFLDRALGESTHSQEQRQA
jgi:hypothetical protein